MRVCCFVSVVIRCDSSPSFIVALQSGRGKSAIESVGANVVEYSFGQELVCGDGACRSRAKLLANPVTKLGCADFDIEPRQQVKRRAVGRRVAEQVGANLDIG